MAAKYPPIRGRGPESNRYHYLVETDSQIQELTTRTSESITEHCLDGHGALWTKVRTGVAVA